MSSSGSARATRSICYAVPLFLTMLPCPCPCAFSLCHPPSGASSCITVGASSGSASKATACSFAAVAGGSPVTERISGPPVSRPPRRSLWAFPPEYRGSGCYGLRFATVCRLAIAAYGTYQALLYNSPRWPAGRLPLRIPNAIPCGLRRNPCFEYAPGGMSARQT